MMQIVIQTNTKGRRTARRFNARQFRSFPMPIALADEMLATEQAERVCCFVNSSCSRCARRTSPATSGTCGVVGCNSPADIESSTRINDNTWRVRLDCLEHGGHLLPTD